MPFAFLLVLPMGGALEEFLVWLKGLAGAKVELFLAVLAEYQAGKDAALSAARSAMALLSDFLHPLKYVHLNDHFMVPGKDRPFFFGIVTGFLIPDRLGEGLEIH